MLRAALGFANCRAAFCISAILSLSLISLSTWIKNNFFDKPFGDYEVVTGTTEEPHEVEAISGATISVENVVKIVEQAVEIIREEYGSGV